MLTNSSFCGKTAIDDAYTQHVGFFLRKYVATYRIKLKNGLPTIKLTNVSPHIIAGIFPVNY